MPGNLTIHPIRAQLTRNTEKFGRRMDPYVRISCGGNTQQSSVSHNMHKTPTWADQIGMRHTTDDVLQIEVWDYDHITRDDLIGSGALSVSSIMQRGNRFRGVVPLTYKGRSSGQIELDIKYVPDGGFINCVPNGVIGQQYMQTTCLPVQQPLFVGQPVQQHVQTTCLPVQQPLLVGPPVGFTNKTYVGGFNTHHQQQQPQQYSHQKVTTQKEVYNSFY